MSNSSQTIRGTQSFVSIMGQVWKRPSLTGLEIAWRWIAGCLLLGLLAPVILGSLGMDVHLTGSSTPIAPPNTAALQNTTVFQPVAAVQTIHSVVSNYLTPLWPFLYKTLLMAIVLWIIVAALGRTIVLRRLDPSLHARRLTIFLLGALRSGLLLATWWLWASYLGFAVNYSILRHAARNEEPNVVLFAAMVIVGTLLLYVLWATFSWFLQLAPLLAMRLNLGPIAALKAALASGEVRGKLIEVNLVMNIVKIALIVLLMVFSASPLPFTNVATQEFLQWWWTIGILLYLAANDYFHVVRAASYLDFYRTYHPTAADQTASNLR